MCSKTIVLSTPNIEHVIDQNPSIAASVYVYVPWWTNESGVLEPVSRASNDGGNTFCPMVKLSSTSTKSIFYFILFFWMISLGSRLINSVVVLTEKNGE
jgi:hypothetical protein